MQDFPSTCDKVRTITALLTSNPHFTSSPLYHSNLVIICSVYNASECMGGIGFSSKFNYSDKKTVPGI